MVAFAIVGGLLAVGMAVGTLAAAVYDKLVRRDKRTLWQIWIDY